MYYKLSSSPSRRPKKKLIIILTVIILLLITGLLVANQSNNKDGRISKSADGASNAPGSTKLNLDGPTEEDKKQVEDNKQKLVEQAVEAQKKPAPGKKQVVPTIVDAGQYEQVIEVRAFIPGIYEAGGTCKVTFSKGSDSFIRVIDAVQDATTTRCKTLNVARGEFTSKGSWLAIVNYDSPAAAGDSQPKTFQVQ